MYGRPRSLTAEQAEELRSRYRMFVANRPKALAREFGISESTLRYYLGERHKQRRRRVLEQTCRHGLPLDGECERCSVEFAA